MAQEWEINLSPKFHLFMTQTNGKAGLESMAMWRGVSFWLAFPLSNWRVGWELFLIVKAKSTTVVGKHIWTRCWQSLYLNVGWEEDSTLDNNSVSNSWVRGGGSFFFRYSFSFLLFLFIRWYHFYWDQQGQMSTQGLSVLKRQHFWMCILGWSITRQTEKKNQ